MERNGEAPCLTPSPSTSKASPPASTASYYRRGWADGRCSAATPATPARQGGVLLAPGAAELVQFLEGRLGERFIASVDQLPPAGPSQANRDGRFGVQEFCCYDSSWQAVLEQLLQRSQVVLMDLRGFGPAHGGCLHELGRLAATPPWRPCWPPSPQTRRLAHHLQAT